MADDESVSSRVWTIWVTSIVDNADHAVTDEEMAVGPGTYAAVCGATVVPPSMADPPRPCCRRCVAFLRARMSLRDLDQRMASRRKSRGRLGRLLGRSRG